MTTSPPGVQQTEITGLTSEQVAQRIAEGRVNDLPARSSRSTMEIVRSNVFTRINAIFAALLCVVASTGTLIDGMFGLLIVANSTVGVVQELRAKHTLDRLTIVGQARPRVRRDGTTREVATNEVVADDVVDMAAGDQIVVDGEVLQGSGLEVDESLLSGESEPIVKDPGATVLSGSFVVAGSGCYRATRVGRDAYAAQLAAQASRFTLVDSQLRNGINRILRVITYLLVPTGALSVYNQLSADEDMSHALRGMVAALVPMVPEGLVLMTAIAFAVGVVRLGQRGCLVNELPAIEGLARVDVVCADKTGTLTENAMELTELRVVDGDADRARRALAALVTAEARPNASLAAIGRAVPDAPGWQVTGVAPFSSARKWSGADFAEHGSWVLGAPDVLLPPDDPARGEAESLAARGLRVLLLGRPPRPVAELETAHPVEPVALLVLDQRIRPDAKCALGYFAAQDVRVKVLSGDNAASVGAVARALGLPGAEHPVDSRSLQDDESVAYAVEEGSVFGRVTPAQKRIMVRAMQNQGHTVAMTGDGVNDVLALKDADIGVAMGSGSPAARSVAQIVLLDNAFATLPHVVAEGRRVIGNIERVSTLFLTKTIYSVALALMVGIPGLVGMDVLPYPFLPRHVTITGWFTIGLPAFVLALAPNVDRARPGFVRRVLRTAVPAGLAVAIACFVSYVVVYDGPDASDRNQVQASTTALMTLIAVALWVLAAVARPLSCWKAGLVAVMVVLSALMFVTPFTRELFELDPGNAHHVWVSALCAGAAVILIELGWWLTSRWSDAPAAARSTPERVRRPGARTRPGWSGRRGRPS